MIDWQAIIDQVNANTGLRLKAGTPRSVSGGCINQAYVLESDRQSVFIKLNDRNAYAMFEAEARGLEAMASAAAIRVPQPLSVGQTSASAYIAMEYIEPSRQGGQNYALFGRQLAAMHRCQAHMFGASFDNTIGSTPQPNHQEADWFVFWRRYRLGFQLELARKNGAPAALYDQGMLLADNFHRLFDKPPLAACLHGDLWQGNWGFDARGNPYLFDPAHYFGDRETDLAMTRLFGGAPDLFYQSYQEHYPLDTGYAIREKFYNIYHIINHFNLFGGAYATQAVDMIRYVLSELK